MLMLPLLAGRGMLPRWFMLRIGRVESAVVKEIATSPTGVWVNRSHAKHR